MQNVDQRLLEKDYVLVIDKSGSMETNDCNGKTRWQSLQESTLAIAKKVTQFDPDGIKVIPFSSSFKVYDNTTEETVDKIFKENEPFGATYLAPVLKNVFEDFLDRKKMGKTKQNGEILIVVTDGCPDDPQEIKNEIIRFTKRLDNGDNEYGILLFQIGNDPYARQYLKQLDDDLEGSGAKFDIVSTKTTEEIEKIGITGALIAALDE